MMLSAVAASADSPGMKLDGYWHVFMADAGNKPGAQQGDVLVTLFKPVGGIDEIRVPSAAVTIAAEAGNLIGVQLVTFDGRHLFVPAQNLAGIVDAPVDSDEGDDGKPSSKSSRGRGPVVVSGT
jgi:hypothetical protein